MHEKEETVANSPIWTDWHRKRSERGKLIYYLCFTFISTILLISIHSYLVFERPTMRPRSIAATPQDVIQVHPVQAFQTDTPKLADTPRYCPQVDMTPQNSSRHKKILSYIRSKKFKENAISDFQHAIRIPTVSYDEMLDEAIRLDNTYYYGNFTIFRNFLKKNFSDVFKVMEPKFINTHGILMAWKGSNPQLKPTLLSAHYDVVPIDNTTLALWNYPPFDATRRFENGTERIYGRGATDMKHSLTSIMSAMQALIKEDFKPRRTVMIAIGFDEELGGRKGALRISECVHECVKDKGIAVISDEGGGQSQKFFNKNMALIGVAEKGYLDVQVDVRVKGGHSSLPDPHTGVGIGAAFVKSVEDDPYDTFLNQGNPMLSLLGCGLQYGTMDPRLQSLVEKRLAENATQPAKENDTLARAVSQLGGPVSRENQLHWLMTTTQAVTMFNGGFKTNVLPELTTIKINHRIHIGETLGDVERKIERHANDTAIKYGLRVFDFNTTAGNTNFEPPSEIDRSISLIRSRPMRPASVTKTELTHNGKRTAYAVVIGTVREIMGDSVIVSPLQNAGNTDTRHYWNVTETIIRYIPGATDADGEAVHTIDESMSVEGHMKGIEYFATFIENMDEADLDEDVLANNSSFTCWDEPGLKCQS